MERSGGGVRLAEILAALSLAMDLGLGQPMQHILRQTSIALRLCDEAGLGEAERSDVYYVSLLVWVGCIADSAEMASLFGDDLAFRADTYEVDLSGASMLLFFARHLGAGRSPLQRLAVVGQLVRRGAGAINAMFAAHCEATGTLAARLGLGPSVVVPLGQAFERWDGKGSPGTAGGDRMSMTIRIVHLADIVEVFHRLGGVDAAVEVARARRGTQFDPALVDLFCARAGAILDGVDAARCWDDVLGAEPELGRVLAGAELDDALAAFADYGDLKSPSTAGHSRGVAALAVAAAGRLGLPSHDVETVRRAALVHDIGVIAVPSTIWEIRGALDEAERERARTHPYLAERVLARSPALRGFGEVAAMHHERLDGSGYPRGLRANAIPMPARLLAAADVYHALTEPRPHRPAFPPAEAERALRAEAVAGRLDGDAVAAVLGAAGHRVRKRPALPAGLTGREVEVLALIARGFPNREVARRLAISPRTVGAHVEHIYGKIGVSTRPAAALFAMRHDLLDPEPPVET